MIQSLFRKNPDYIEIYDNALSKKECEILINQFEKTDNIERGYMSNGYDPKKKNCLQLCYDVNDQSIVSNIIKLKLNSCIKQYNKKYCSLQKILNWKTYPDFNIQKYNGEDDGYKVWHCEHGKYEHNSKRIMAWMFYLNDAKSGTEFANYPTINAKMGRCVIWPSFWTHLHRGVIPNKGIKYIATGWFVYD